MFVLSFVGIEPVISFLFILKSLHQFNHVMPLLTHLSLAALLWDIGEQNSPRCDAAKRGVPSGAILFA